MNSSYDSTSSRPSMQKRLVGGGIVVGALALAWLWSGMNHGPGGGESGVPDTEQSSQATTAQPGDTELDADDRQSPSPGHGDRLTVRITGGEYRILRDDEYVPLRWTKWLKLRHAWRATSTVFASELNTITPACRRNPIWRPHCSKPDCCETSCRSCSNPFSNRRSLAGMNVGERQRQVRIIGIQRKSRGYGNDLDPQLTKRLQVEKLCA